VHSFSRHRTSNIKIGCGFNITPMWHRCGWPKDYASPTSYRRPGRGSAVGRGYHTREVETFGSPLLTRRPTRELCEEQVDIIFKAFNSESFS